VADRLPVFVYGTLRRGQLYHGLLDGAVEAAYTAMLPGHRLYAGRYPYIAEHPDGRVVGDLMVLKPDGYGEVLARLDELEGFQPPDRELYVRVARRVRFRSDRSASAPWQAARAWVYLGGDSFDYRDDLAIPDGDWVRSRIM
jgi:gamma-glutamylcyclotransferase (GGCT)/AIG2-like uncharacterized protein YtfP